MTPADQRLAELRLRIAEIDRKYTSSHRPARYRSGGDDLFWSSPEKRQVSKDDGLAHSAEVTRAALRYVEDWLGGELVETALGCHFEAEKLYEAHRHHGSADIGALADLPHDLLETISNGQISAAAPEQWAFLDTETTGPAGGATCAFLIGVGRIARDGFRVRQFFMRDHGEEASVLDAVGRHLADFRVMITYNGRAFDQPLLENRYRFLRVRAPFDSLHHLDLLHGARRLWKLRFDSCRLVDLENRVLGVERQGDLPGALIPYVYFEYLRTRQAARVLPIFQHNAVDILSLACLAGIVPFAFKDPASVPLRHGEEMAGIARWLTEAGEFEQARTLFRRAVTAGLPDRLLFRTRWDLALLERKMGADEAALEIWHELATSYNPFQVAALEALAKHHEHRSKDPKRALECTQSALELESSTQLERREQRLLKRLAAGNKIRKRAKKRETS